MERMTTNEIARDEWESFLDGFSRQHEGWTVTVEVFESGGDARVEATDVPFAGVAVGGDDGGRETISVMVGRAPEQHLTHTITAPKRVVLDQSGIDAGIGERLEIVSGDGTRTHVRFHSPVLPEQLDGVDASGR